MQEMWVPSLGWEDALEKEMATNSGILAWEIPWTEQPGGLPLMGSQEQDRDTVSDGTTTTQSSVLMVLPGHSTVNVQIKISVTDIFHLHQYLIKACYQR